MMSAKGYLNTGKRKFKRVKYREFYEGHGKNGLFGKGMNCDLVSGGIYPAMETELFVLNGKTSAVYGATDGIMKIARAERNGFIEKNFAYLTGGGYLHSFNFVEDGFNGVGHRFVKTPEIFNVFEKDGDEIVVFASRDGVVLYDFIGGVETVLWTASSAAFCFHDRIFAGYQSDLYFSAHQDYRNFTESTDEGGKISLPSEKGYIVGGCVVGENCYLIFQRGIMKLTATGAARDFVIEEVPYDGAEIVPASAKPVGQYLFFLTREGPVRFDGKRSEKICEEMANENIEMRNLNSKKEIANACFAHMMIEVSKLYEAGA
ncbi:MAG: hypothetical protein IIX01_01460, partial [Clostridia bacterium]|nr:hypothetical protein [Clostridia bacterium]